MPEKHEAFFIEYPNLTLELYTKVELFSPLTMKKQETFAIWDTGATISSISPELQKKLNLEPIGLLDIEGINSLEPCEQVLVHVGLPNMIIVPDVRPVVCVFGPPDLGFIIGMDIIKLGDLMISNSHGKTLFSFATPPLPMRINLVNQADNLNCS